MGGRGNTGSRSTVRTFNSAEAVTSFIQGELDKFGLGISKDKLAEQIYRTARAEGMNVTILNGKYLIVENENGKAEFSFTKSKKEDRWKLTPMLSYGDVTTGRHNGVSMFRTAGQWFSRKEYAEGAVVKKKLG